MASKSNKKPTRRSDRLRSTSAGAPPGAARPGDSDGEESGLVDPHSPGMDPELAAALANGGDDDSIATTISLGSDDRVLDEEVMLSRTLESMVADGSLPPPPAKGTMDSDKGWGRGPALETKNASGKEPGTQIYKGKPPGNVLDSKQVKIKVQEQSSRARTKTRTCFR